MQKLLSSLLVVAAGLALSGCKKSPTESPPAAAPKPAVASAEKTSFQEVTAQLDPGGSLYLYLSTEQLLGGVSEKLAQWRGLVDALPDTKSAERDNLGKVFDVVTRVVKESGIEDVSGVGMSSIARAPGLYHGKVLVHHYRGKGDGFLWALFGQKPHALGELNLLPSNTVLASCFDFDLRLLWSVIQKEAGRSGLRQAEETLNRVPEGFQKATGLSWEKTLASLGGTYGIALTLDDTRMITIPLPGQSLEIPEPGLMLIARVKDDTLFNRIDEALQQTGQEIKRTDTPNLKMRTWPLPLPLPIQLRPTIARTGDYLIIATTDALVQEALAVQAGQKPGLKATPEFQRLAKDVPQQGNQFTFISQRFGGAAMGLQRGILSKLPAAQAQWMDSLVDTNNAAFTYSVGASTDEGWLAVANGNQHPAKLFVAGAVVPVAMLSAIALPNFVKARNVAQKNACINNLRQIDGAKRQWALENSKPETAVPTEADLTQFLRGNKLPVCPAGGSYTINSVGDRPQCSHSGHSLGE